MIRLSEFTVFTGIAIAVHLGLFVQFGPTGTQSQGAAGQASISLMAGSPEMAERVAAWTQPVQAVQLSPAPPALAPAERVTMPAVSRPEVQHSPAALPRLTALPPPTSDAPPRIDTQTAEPPPRFAPQASPRPQTRIAPKPKAVAKPKAQSAAKPKTRTTRTAPTQPQRAKGGATGNNAGNTKRSQSATLSKAAQQSLMASWGASIRNRVERRKRYPTGTTASGTTVLRITLSRGGRLRGVSVVRSSGARRLDQAALQAVQRARYPAAPKGLSAAQYVFNLPVAFRRN